MHGLMRGMCKFRSNKGKEKQRQKTLLDLVAEAGLEPATFGL